MKTRLTYLVIFLLMLFSGAISAHPHNWIELQSNFTFNNQGELIKIKQIWEFDIYYSTIRLKEIDHDYSDQQTGLDTIAKEMAKNLAAFDYFSELIIDETQTKLPKPTNPSLAVINSEAQRLLYLSMEFSFKKPLTLENKKLSWRVFDPTYYIDMKHSNTANIIINQNSPSPCNAELIAPEPSSEMIRYATNLDRTQKGIQGLGSYFAEQVVIRCPSL